MPSTELSINPFISFEFNQGGDLIGIEFRYDDSLCDPATVIHDDHIEEVDAESRPAFVEYIDQWCSRNFATIVQLR